MIRPSDRRLIGLKQPDRATSAANLVPTSGGAQPFRDMAKLYPRWAADQRPRLTVRLGDGGYIARAS